MKINLPKLPSTHYELAVEADRYEDGFLTGMPGFMDEDMEQYARDAVEKYAEEIQFDGYKKKGEFLTVDEIWASDRIMSANASDAYLNMQALTSFIRAVELECAAKWGVELTDTKMKE